MASESAFHLSEPQSPHLSKVGREGNSQRTSRSVVRNKYDHIQEVLAHCAHLENTNVSTDVWMSVCTSALLLLSSQKAHRQSNKSHDSCMDNNGRYNLTTKIGINKQLDRRLSNKDARAMDEWTGRHKK